jgi:hypothetical protein
MKTGLTQEDLDKFGDGELDALYLDMAALGLIRTRTLIDLLI